MTSTPTLKPGLYTTNNDGYFYRLLTPLDTDHLYEAPQCEDVPGERVIVHRPDATAPRPQSSTGDITIIGWPAVMTEYPGSASSDLETASLSEFVALTGGGDFNRPYTYILISSGEGYVEA